MESRATASIIIIGDEILRGQTKDSNSHFLCRELYKCGVRVERISVIPDVIDIIAEEIIAHSAKFNFVLTSGGIGTTHDDVTYEGIAKAFGEKLVLIKEAARIFVDLGLDEISANKISKVPQSSELHHTKSSTGGLFMPIVSIKNVFVFPGIPFYLEQAFKSLRSIFASGSAFLTSNVYVAATEGSITETLNKVVKEFEGCVKFGSYPVLFNPQYLVQISLEGNLEADIVRAEAYLRNQLAPNTVVGEHPPSSEEALKKLDVSLKGKDKDFANALQDSINILEQCFVEYKHENVCVSFNGGKDCTVLLHLVYLALRKRFPERKSKLKVMYVHSLRAFEEVEEFIDTCVRRYDLDLISYDPPIKEALAKLQRDHPQIQAVLMGCRRTDPRCSELKSFQMTDRDWPQFMRVNPIGSWSYQQVWKFLRCLDVSYCGLYDKGYTSLGCQHNTLPNEQLLASTKDGESYYLPAYLLKESAQERKGRAINKI